MAVDSQFLWYNAMDSAVTFEIWKKLEDEIDKDGYRWTYDFTKRICEPLRYMMYRGILVNHEKLAATRKDAVEQQGALQEELNTLAGRYLNPLSSKDCQNYFYIEKGIKPFTKRNSEGESIITCDDKAMQRLAKGALNRPAFREASLVQQIRSLNKLIGTYLDITFDEDGRFRCSVNPRGTVTGRISTSQTIFGTGMNMQNLPARFKAFLVADPGHILIEPDKAGAEWVVVAYLSGDGNMLRVVEERRDPHATTASLMFNLPIELVQFENKLVGHETDPTEIATIRERCSDLKGLTVLPRTMSLRQMGKKSNHGLNYDEGFGTFALVNELIDSEAKKYVELYHSIYPNIRNIWYNRVKDQLRRTRCITNFFGRKRRFYDRWGDSLFKAAYAQEPQSTVSDNLNLGMCEIYEDTSRVMQPCDLLANVHDSMLSQYPDSNIEDLADCVLRQKKCMDKEIEINGRSFTIGTSIKVGYDWGEEGMHELKHLDDRQALIEELKGIVDGKQKSEAQ